MRAQPALLALLSALPGSDAAFTFFRAGRCVDFRLEPYQSAKAVGVSTLAECVATCDLSARPGQVGLRYNAATDDCYCDYIAGFAPCIGEALPFLFNGYSVTECVSSDQTRGPGTEAVVSTIASPGEDCYTRDDVELMPIGVVGVPDDYTFVRTGVNEVFTMNVLESDVLFPATFPKSPLRITIPVVSPSDSSGSCVATANRKAIEYRPNALFTGTTSCKYTACYFQPGQEEVCSNEVDVTITIKPRVNKLVVQDDYFPDPVPNNGRVTTLDVLRNDDSPGNQPLTILEAGYTADPFPGAPGMGADGAPSLRGGFCKPNADSTEIIYTSPNGVFQGSDKCTYTTCDEAKACKSATVFILDVCPAKTSAPTPTISLAPQCSPFTVTSAEETINIDVLSKCTASPGADPLVVARVTPVPVGLLRSGEGVAEETDGVSEKRLQKQADRQGIEVIFEDGVRSTRGGFCFPSVDRRSVVYFPPPTGFTGVDSCFYVVRDTRGNEGGAVVTIIVQSLITARPTPRPVVPTPTISPSINDISFDVPFDKISRVSPLVNDIPAPGAGPLKINSLLDIGVAIELFPTMIEQSMQRKYRKRIEAESGNGRKGQNERQLQQREVPSLLGGTCRIAANNLEVVYTPPAGFDPPFVDFCVYEAVDQFGVFGVALIGFVNLFDDPTLAPSLSPTLSPTLLPTLAPSELVPTLSPSLAPTLSPTISPTLLPTQEPTTDIDSDDIIPTMAPSQSPTLYPTLYPTFEPTVEDSKDPDPTPPSPTPPGPGPLPPGAVTVVIVQPVFILPVQCSPYPWDPIYQGFPPGSDLQININYYGSNYYAGKAGKTKGQSRYEWYNGDPYFRNRKADDEETFSEETGERKRRRRMDETGAKGQKDRRLQLYRWCQPGEISWEINYSQAPLAVFPAPTGDVAGLLNQMGPPASAVQGLPFFRTGNRRAEPDASEEGG